jgi:hypothetical protein
LNGRIALSPIRTIASMLNWCSPGYDSCRMSLISHNFSCTEGGKKGVHEDKDGRRCCNDGWMAVPEKLPAAEKLTSVLTDFLKRV